MAMPVSYILATRNRAKFLAKALENVRTYIQPGDELIVVDGGSTDETAEVVGRNRDIVTTFVSEADLGEAHALNKGLLLARHEIIKNVTDDDEFIAEGLKKALGVMEANPGIDVLMCGGECYAASETGPAKLTGVNRFPPGVAWGRDAEAVLVHSVCGLGLVLRRRSLSKVGLFATNVRAVDSEFMLRLLATKAEFRYADICIYRHFEYGHSGQARSLECFRDIIRGLLNHQGSSRMVADYGFAPVLEALRLKDIPGGRALARVVWTGYRLRLSRVGRLILGVMSLMGLAGITVLHPFWNGPASKGAMDEPWSGKLL